MKKILILACTFIMLYSSTVASEKAFGTQTLDKAVAQTAIQTQPIDNLTETFHNEIKTFFSDIDGTLIPCDKSVPKGTIPASVIEGASELRNANIPLILITGRSSYEARKIAQKIGIKNQFVIGQQGGEILNAQDVLIYEDGIPSKAVKKMIADINAFNKELKDQINPFIYVKGTMYAFKNIDFPYIFDKPTKINSVSDIGKDFTAIKIGLYTDDPVKLRAIQQYLVHKYPKFNVVISADCYCDISSKTATKGHAIEILTKMLGIDLKNVATIGDTENDISMLKLLKDNGGLAIVVDNANSKTKENANYISSSVSNGGFLKAVKNVLKNNNFLKLK